MAGQASADAGRGQEEVKAEGLSDALPPENTVTVQEVTGAAGPDATVLQVNSAGGQEKDTP